MPCRAGSDARIQNGEEKHGANGRRDDDRGQPPHRFFDPDDLSLVVRTQIVVYGRLSEDATGDVVHLERRLAIMPAQIKEARRMKFEVRAEPSPWSRKATETTTEGLTLIRRRRDLSTSSNPRFTYPVAHRKPIDDERRTLAQEHELTTRTQLRKVMDAGHRMVEKRAFTPAVIFSGVAVGIFQAFSPIVLRWLDAADVWGVALALIAAVYVGFAVADGRKAVIVVEVTVAFAFVICATVAMASFPWLIVIGLVAHGLKDLWQHRTQFVANTRWWPPFCLVVDVVAAALTAALLLGGTHLRGLLP